MESNFNFYNILPLLVCALSVPLSVFMWLGHIAFLKFSNSDPTIEGVSAIGPTRWLFSTIIPIILMIYGLKRKSVNKSGAALGLVIAILCTVANYAFFVSLFIFFFTSSRATKYKGDIKKKFEQDYKVGGQRNWIQVLCNGGMALQLSVLYLLDCGSGERPINFVDDYRSSWLQIAVLSAFACCNGDTWASELGSVLSKSNPYLITTFKIVPRGTNGGISTIGLIVSFLGGLSIGLGYYITLFYTVDKSIWSLSPIQWPIIFCGGAAGLFGSIIDSIMGATLQFSGITNDGKIVEKPDKNVRHISGLGVLDNHSVNLISSILTGIIMPTIAFHLWPTF